MILGRAIALDPTSRQAGHLRRACGTARCRCNWGLAAWQRMWKCCEKPSADKIKRRWNAHCRSELAWSYDVTKCAGGQAALDLGTTFANFLQDCKKPRQQRRFPYPRPGKPVRIAKPGVARLHEELGFAGKIVVSFSGGRRFMSVQVKTDSERDPAFQAGRRSSATIAGGDNETGRAYGPKPRRRLLGRLKRTQRPVSRQKHRTKKLGQKASYRRHIRQLRLSRLHSRMAKLRKDAANKPTTDLTRRFETIVIENLNLSGMARTMANPNNHSLAGAGANCGWYEIRRQHEDKAAMRDGRIVIADRFFPSTPICTYCGALTGNKGREKWHVERWIGQPLPACASVPASA
jgi:putative transposase